MTFDGKSCCSNGIKLSKFGASGAQGISAARSRCFRNCFSASVRGPRGRDVESSFIRVERVCTVDGTEKSELKAAIWEGVGG